MNINEKIEREYNLYYDTNKSMLSKERKITIYNVLELEREHKLNEIIRVENQEIGFMSISTNIVIVAIYMVTLMTDLNGVFGFGNVGLQSYSLFAFVVISIYLLYTVKESISRKQERIKVKAANKKIEGEMVNISTKQLVIKRLLLEEDNMKL